jgi:hypothetical protein
MLRILALASALAPCCNATENLTPEQAKAEVERVFLEVLQRYPDEQGLKTHARFLMEGKSVEWLEKTLAESSEGKRVAERRRRRGWVVAVPVAVLAVAFLVVFLRRKSAKDFVFKTALILLPLVVAACLLEIGLRFRAGRFARKTAEAWRNVEGARRPGPNASATLRDVIHLSPHDDVVYEMFPDLCVRFLGKRLTTDEQGFRVTPGSADDPGVPCIVGLGDSVMFGWGVADEDTYLARLCSRLAPVKVINTAVPGYNTVMQAATLERKALRHRPDLVLLHFVENDLHLPNFIPREDPTIRRTRSYLLAEWSQWLGGRWRAHTFARLARSDGTVPAACAHMVGEEACVRSLRKLAGLAQTYDFRVAVICNWTAPAFLQSAATDLEFPVIELGETIRSYRAEHDIKGFEGSVLTVSRHDPHYSALAHGLVAETIYQRLKSEGLL